MFVPTSASEISNVPVLPVAATGQTPATKSEHHREFESVLSQAVPRFQKVTMRSLRNPQYAEGAIQNAVLSALPIRQTKKKSQECDDRHTSTYDTAVLYRSGD